MYVRAIILDYSVGLMELHTESTLQVSYSIFRQPWLWSVAKPWPLVLPQTASPTFLYFSVALSIDIFIY